MNKKEWEIYQRLCVGCENERRCHKECETCKEFDEAIEGETKE